MTAKRLVLAERLLACGAGVSAIRVLGGMRGALANRVRVRARGAKLELGVYALGVLLDGPSIALPLEVHPGPPDARDPEFASASNQALAATRGLLMASSLPSLRLELEALLPSFGGSVGLAAALAFLWHAVRPERRPRVPVLATGALSAIRGILAVECVERKLEIALAELGSAPGLVLVPAQVGASAEARRRDPRVHWVSTLEAAVSLVFGSAHALDPDPRLLALDSVIDRAQKESDHARALALLDAVPTVSLTNADRARVQFERGTRLRHLGQSEQAAKVHAGALELLQSERSIVGAEAAERFELEHFGTQLDQFELEACLAGLGARLDRPFLLRRNEMRCRGLLAQALAMSGRFVEAVNVRRENLELQEREDWMRRVLPGTFCYLALDSALAGNGAHFDGYARKLVLSTPQGDSNQWRYNAAALVRGLVALGRYRSALQWAHGTQELFGTEPPADLLTLSVPSGPQVTTHPEVSVVRALCRARRCVGAVESALRLASRVPRQPADGDDLVAWLRQLVHIEAALALHHLGQQAEADLLAQNVRATLQLCHAPATRHYHALLTAPLTTLDEVVDRVWY